MTNSKRLKRSIAMLVTILLMASSLAACGGKGDTTASDTASVTASETSSAAASDAASEAESAAASETGSATESAAESATESAATSEATSETSSAAASSTAVSSASETSSASAGDSSTITQEEAIELVKQELSGDYSYIPASELEERDGSRYYAIYVKQLLDAGTYTTLTTYLVKTDGSEVFEKYDTSSSTTEGTDTSSYFGEYVHSGETGETTFTVYEDGTFEMLTVGDANQVVTGVYELGITNDANVIKLIVYPRKNVVESNGEETELEVAYVEGTAVIEGDTLTLSMESMPTVFTKK